MTEQPDSYDLTAARATAESAVAAWGLTIGEPFAMSHVSFVAPAGDAVVKVAWEGDDESLHEADALLAWNGDGAVRLVRRAGRALLIERAVPGTDISRLDDADATAIAIDVAHRLWRPAAQPFRPVAPAVERWLDEAASSNGERVARARDLFASMSHSARWLVHGDLHHHNILRHGGRYVAIDPKPFLGDREYDVASFLWNPIGNDLRDADETERRIAAFVASGLDEWLIRAWAAIRGAFLRPELADALSRLAR